MKNVFMKNVLLIGLILLCSSCGSKLGKKWVRKTSKSGKFTVLLPGKVKTQSLTHRVAGTNLKQTVYGTESRDAAAMVSYFKMPSAWMKDIDIDDGLKGILDEALQKVSGRLIKKRKIKLGKHPGLEFSYKGRIKGDSVTCYARSYVANSRVYTVLAILKKKSAFSKKDRSKFFKSFKITG